MKTVGYSEQDIEEFIDNIEKKHIIADMLPLAELCELLKAGWVIYDTQPMANTEDMKFLTLVKIK